MSSDHWPDYANWYQHHLKCDTMILSYVTLVCIQYENMDVWKSTYRYAFTCLFISSLYWVFNMLSNVIMLDQFIHNNFGIVSILGQHRRRALAHHRTVSCAHLSQCYRDLYDFMFCINDVCLRIIASDRHWQDYLDLYQRHHECFVTMLSKLAFDLYLYDNMNVRIGIHQCAFSCIPPCEMITDYSQA